MTKTKNKISEWRKDFDEAFENIMSMFFDRNEKKEKFKSFIHDLLNDVLEEVRLEEIDILNAPSESKILFGSGWNKAVQKLNQKIDNIKKEL